MEIHVTAPGGPPGILVEVKRPDVLPPVAALSKGFDLKSSTTVTVLAGSTEQHCLGYSIKVPKGHVGRVSNALFDPKIDVNPVFVPCTSHPLSLTLCNKTAEDIRVEKGDVIAHMVVLHNRPRLQLHVKKCYKQ